MDTSLFLKELRKLWHHADYGYIMMRFQKEEAEPDPSSKKKRAAPIAPKSPAEPKSTKKVQDFME